MASDLRAECGSLNIVDIEAPCDTVERRVDAVQAGSCVVFKSLKVGFESIEAAPREHLRMNSRATALCWYYNVRIDSARLIVGDVVVSGAVTPEQSADVPEQVLAGLLSPHEFVVQVSPDDDGVWHDTSARFGNIFEAALWCMLFAHAVYPGPGFRFTVNELSDEPRGAWGSGSW